jgi:SAM-dependent methyltransferase
MIRNAIAGCIVAAALPTLSSILHGQDAAHKKPDVHFVVTRQPVVDAMLDLAGTGANDVVYDLGSGDGRIVITAARRFGARGVGIEIDTHLVNLSNRRAQEAGVGRRVRFLQQDLFTSDLSAATVVTMYLGPVLHQRLRPILQRQLRPGTRIVTHGWDMGEWEPDARTEADGRYLFFWIVPADVAGVWQWRAADGSRQVLLLEQRYQMVSGRWVRNADTLPIAGGRVAGDSLRLRLVGRGAAFEFKGRVRGDAIDGTVKRNGQAVHWTARRPRLAYGG